MTEWAREQELEVFRALPTGKVDKESFLNTYEENGFKVHVGKEENAPSQYSLSTYLKFKHVKRFMNMNSGYGIPHKIAQGITNPIR